MRRKQGGILQQETPVPEKGQDPCTPEEAVPQLGWVPSEGWRRKLEC